MAMKSRGFSRGRRIAGVLEGLGTTAVLATLVAALLYAATRPGVRMRIDLTAEERYSLSDQTRQVLAALEHPVEFVSIMRPESTLAPTGLAVVQMQAADYVHNLLREYEIASGGQVSVRILDAFADRLDVQELVKDLHLAPRPNVVLVTGPTRTEQVFLDELVTIDRGTADPQQIRLAELVDLRAEGPLTSALLSVTAEVRPRIGFLTGTAAPRMDDFDRGGLGLFVEALRLQGLEPQTFELFSSSIVPPELDLVAVVGAQTRLDRSTVQALSDFHADGGAVLLALDPESPTPPLDDAEMERWLARLGLVRGRALLCRDNTLAEGAPRALLPIRGFGSNQITEPIARQGVFGTFLATGEVERHPTAGPRVIVEHLAWTGSEVFADRPNSPDTVYGDYTFDPGMGESRESRLVAVARDSVEGDGRVVLFGTAKFLSNDGVTNGGAANLSLGLNAANWLVGREDAVATRPLMVYESRVDLFEDEQEDIFTYTAVMMPLCGALLGLLVWFKRRR